MGRGVEQDDPLGPGVDRMARPPGVDRRKSDRVPTPRLPAATRHALRVRVEETLFDRVDVARERSALAHGLTAGAPLALFSSFTSFPLPPPLSVRAWFVVSVVPPLPSGDPHDLTGMHAVLVGQFLRRPWH